MDESEEYIEVEEVEVEVELVIEEDVSLAPRPIDFYAFLNGATAAYMDDQFRSARPGNPNGLRYAAEVEGGFQGFVAHTLPPASASDPSFPTGVIADKVRGRYPPPGSSLKWSVSHSYEALLRVTCDGTRPVRAVTDALIARLGPNTATEVNRSYNIVVGVGAEDPAALDGLVSAVETTPGVRRPVSRHNVIRSNERP